MAMVIHLGKEPKTEEAHTAMREWIQARVDKHDGWGDSFWLQKEMFFEIIDKGLRKKIFECWD